MSTMLEGVFTALVTPFSNGEIDWAALEGLVEFQLRGGIHGLVPCGTTGESATLSADEHDRLVRFVVERVAGRVPVLAGTGSNSTAEAVRHTLRARDCGADAALVITPYYNKPTPAGLLEHYRQVAAVGLPVVVYNVPSRTGVCIDAETYSRLADIPGIVATKEASGRFDLIEEVFAQGRLDLFSGDDALTLPLLCLGARGVISVASNVAPRAMVDLFDYVQEHHLSEARELHRRLLPLFGALFAETNPTPVKSALHSLGLIRDELRLPLLVASAATRARLEDLLEDLELTPDFAD
ncbi:MAG: 4-hydroxy-tetrahydrodipicolinate synthase [Planctomycetota bacterium]